MCLCVCVYSTETTQAFDSSKDHQAPSENTDSSLAHTDAGTGEDQGSSLLNGSGLDNNVGGTSAMSEFISTMSLEAKSSQESVSESPSLELLKSSSIISISQPKRGINVKEILKSLVAAPVEGLELEPASYPDPTAKNQAQTKLPVQFHSFDR